MKLIICCLLLLTINCSRNPRTICICDYLYYDWEGRRMGELIPVLNEQQEMIGCSEISEEK